MPTGRRSLLSAGGDFVGPGLWPAELPRGLRAGGQQPGVDRRCFGRKGEAQSGGP